MRPGNYQISAEKDLYQKFESAITISRENIQSFQFELLPLPGKLILQGLPTETTIKTCLLYTSPSPRDMSASRMPSSA